MKFLRNLLIFISAVAALSAAVYFLLRERPESSYITVSGHNYY